MSKSLHLIRSIKWKYPNYKLYCTDSNTFFALKASNCIEKSFHLIYADSTNEVVLKQYLESLITIIRDYEIDIIVPGCSIEEAKCLSILKGKLKDLGLECDILIEGLDVLAQLDDKDKFFNLFNDSKIIRDDDNARIESMDISAEMATYYGNEHRDKVLFPFSITFEHKHKLTAFIENNGLLVNEEVDPEDYRFILKRIVLSNNRDEHIIKLPTTKRELLQKIVVNEDEPWILQHFIKGSDIVACVYCKDGNVQMYCDSICCDCCVNYYPLHNEHIQKWLTRKCAEFKLNGLICFDFIQSDDSRCFVLECNPRPHSCTVLMNDPQWITHLIEPMAKLKEKEMYNANANEKEHVFWLFHEMLRIFGVLNMFPERYNAADIMNAVYRKDAPSIFVDEFGYLHFNVKGVLVGRDAIINVYDPWPVVVSHGVHMPLLIMKQILNGCKGWSVFDLCIVKLVGNDL